MNEDFLQANMPMNVQVVGKIWKRHELLYGHESPLKFFLSIFVSKWLYFMSRKNSSWLPS